MLKIITEPEYVTAINQDEKKIVVAFRGTDATLTNIYDNIADLQIAFGFIAETPIPSYIPSRFSTAEMIYKKVKEQPAPRGAGGSELPIS